MSQFEDVCQQLIAVDDLDYLQKPISYWARQVDRGLPYALLQLTVRDVIDRPFLNLNSTPGIGPKKLASLIVLLQRALAEGVAETRVVSAEEQPIQPTLDFDAETVSESSWEDWRATVRGRGLANHLLGVLTPSLRDLPTVIWATTLGEYLDYSLDELRELKTHGRKRIQTVLEVFHIVHSIFDEVGSHAKFCIVLRPSFVQPIEHWIQCQIDKDLIPNLRELRENLTLPLLNQIQVDAGDTVHQLAAGRLGIEAAPESVRTQAERLDVTRARIYQQLDTCVEIMRIRWPAGRRWLAELAVKFDSLGSNDPRRALFDATRWLVFPERVDQRVVASVMTFPPVDDDDARNREDYENVVG